MPSEIPAGVGTDDSKLDEVVCQCPRSVKTAVWIYMVMSILGLVILFVSLPSEIRERHTTELMLLGHSYHINIWIGAAVYATLIGLLIVLGFQVLKGKVWAFYVLGLLAVSGIINGSTACLTVSSVKVSVFDVLILLLLVIGFREYRNYCQSRRRIGQSIT